MSEEAEHGVWSRLDPHAGGVWQVVTEASIYVVDLDEGRMLRAPGASLGTHVATDGALVQVQSRGGDNAWVPLHDLLECRVGQPMVALCEPFGDGEIKRRQTTFVLSIVPLHATGETGS